MEEYNNTFSDLKRGFVACFKIAMIFTIIFSAFLGSDLNLINILLTLGLSCLYSFGLGFGNGYINVILDQKWDWLSQTNLRVYFGVLFTILYTVPAVLAINYIIFVVIQKLAIEEFFNERMLFIHLFYIVLSLGVSTFMQARSFMVKWKQASKTEVTKQKILAGNANAKFESLKNQIDPHFLFNSLNVLSSLIEENPNAAQRFTTSLAKVYRYVLEQKDKELVSVEEELSFARTYMNLLKMRFENSLSFEIIEVQSVLEAKVIPLSLQLLLENTVKHNVASEKKPLHIKIFVEGDFLVVQNNFQKKAVLQDRNGVGLQNIVDRYAIVTDRKVIIAESTTFFEVKLPLLTKQISAMNSATIISNEQRIYYRARKKVEDLKGLYGNLISYICVIPLLVYVNLEFTPNFQWFWFSAAGWAIGIILHTIKVFGYSTNWEERKIREIMNKNKF